MDKKIECEIVQDLLLGYVDDVLNTETKKLVKKHLAECNICQEKLNEIQQDIKTNENNQKKQIDYLKKIRRRNIIKSMMIAIGIILVICLVIYLRKFIIVNDFTNKANISLKSENFYIETTERISSSEVALTKEWYKNGKYKMVTEIYSDDGVEIKPVEYATIDTDERIIIDNANKIVTIEKGEFTQLINKEKSLKNPQFGTTQYNFASKFRLAFLCSITRTSRGLGREYYVLTNLFDNEYNYVMWIDKESGLPLKISSNGTSRFFYEGTNVVKEEIEVCSEYRYEFDNVTDVDVSIPNYTGYEINYKNTNIEK